ncbi:hypothetical protein [Photobacterium rosenbergii]|uniref:hypothetical protein n=1 Tax=Photobacterium rosenbergii TaxID=294936 RepID=UPI001C9962AA|nr:hypothetical protein [Photobacterium rosenbergii]MBY5945239.1 hypothetical protein [Photobacterium rosenbergii]
MLGLMIGIIILTNTAVLSAVLFLSKRYRKVRRQYEAVHYKLIQLNQELDIARFTIRKLVDREIEHDEVSSNVRCQPTDYGKEAV